MSLCYRFSLGFSVLALVAVGTSAQKLDATKPSAYLTFKEIVRGSGNQSPSQMARLILHNNSRWPTQYGEWMEPALPGDVALIYTIELENGCFGGRRHIDVVTTRKINAGEIGKLCGTARRLAEIQRTVHCFQFLVGINQR